MDWLELLLSLFFAVGCAPLAFFQANCPCCCPPCTFCTAGGTGTPCSVQVVVSGMVDASCSDCELFDATYIVVQNPLIPCNWNLTITSNCGITTTRLQFNPLGTGTWFRLGLTGANTQKFCWETTTGAWDECANWSSFALTHSPINSSGTECTATTATCEITAL